MTKFNLRLSVEKQYIFQSMIFKSVHMSTQPRNLRKKLKETAIYWYYLGNQ